MSNDTTHIKFSETSVPLDKAALLQVGQQNVFSYRQAIGEIIYAMVTCGPDISFPLIKLSQYSTHPSIGHFKAVKIYIYTYK